MPTATCLEGVRAGGAWRAPLAAWMDLAGFSARALGRFESWSFGMCIVGVACSAAVLNRTRLSDCCRGSRTGVGAVPTKFGFCAWEHSIRAPQGDAPRPPLRRSWSGLFLRVRQGRAPRCGLCCWRFFRPPCGRGPRGIRAHAAGPGRVFSVCVVSSWWCAVWRGAGQFPAALCTTMGRSPEATPAADAGSLALQK